MKHLIIILILFLLSFDLQGQVNDHYHRLWVIRQDKIEISYKFNNHDSTVTYLKYLGTIHDLNHKKYKILNSIWISGPSHRATNRILVYSDKNTYIGQYNVIMTYDLPDKIINNKLAFLHLGREDTECYNKSKSYIDFNYGPPKEMFISCAGNTGDIWSFSK